MWITEYLQPTGEERSDSVEVDCFCVSPFLNVQTYVSENLKDLEGSLSKTEQLGFIPRFFVDDQNVISNPVMVI